eukprot:2477213-Rhodomonas_salina.1
MNLCAYYAVSGTDLRRTTQSHNTQATHGELAAVVAENERLARQYEAFEMCTMMVTRRVCWSRGWSPGVHEGGHAVCMLVTRGVHEGGHAERGG